MKTKFFLTNKGTGQEQEVSKADYVVAERAEGKNNTMDRPNEPATSYFNGKYKSGRIEYNYGS